MTNKETFAATYAQAFQDSYPQLNVEKSKPLIEKATKIALENIHQVNINGAAFKLTFKRLGIKHTKKAVSEFFNRGA